jgi:hypothetical protein
MIEKAALAVDYLFKASLGTDVVEFLDPGLEERVADNG